MGRMVSFIGCTVPASNVTSCLAGKMCQLVANINMTD